MMGDNEQRYVDLLTDKVTAGIKQYPGVPTAVQLAMATEVGNRLITWAAAQRATYLGRAADNANHSKHVDHREKR